MGFCCHRDTFLFFGVNGFPGTIGLRCWVDQSAPFYGLALLGPKQVAVNG